MFVKPQWFAWQMRSLARRGYRTMKLDEYAAAVEGRVIGGRALLLTFDDAYAHVDPMVTPILEECRFSAVMFASWGHLGGHNTWDSDHPRLAQLEIASPEQLRSMERGPWEVASHALCHVDLRKLEANQRRTQLVEARERLSDLLRRPVLELAYPFGDQDADVRDDTRAAGYRMAFTAGSSKAGDPFQLPRRPISGRDSALIFRLKTSARAASLYRMRQLSRRVTGLRRSA